MSKDEPRAGDVWRHKRDTYRTVRLRKVDGDAVFPIRNTSRRRQAIGVATLRRDYRLESRA